MLKLESENESKYFATGHKIAVIVNNTGGNIILNLLFKLLNKKNH